MLMLRSLLERLAERLAAPLFRGLDALLGGRCPLCDGEMLGGHCCEMAADESAGEAV